MNSRDPRPPRAWWAVLGLVLSAVIVVIGLVGLGFVVLFMVGISSWASNK